MKIKCQAIEQFSLKEFHKLANIKRKQAKLDGTLFIGDVFECDKQMAEYLSGNNHRGKAVVKILEIIPMEEKDG